MNTNNDLENSILTIKSDIGHIKSTVLKLNKKENNQEDAKFRALFHLYENLFLDPNKSEELDAYMQSHMRHADPAKVADIAKCGIEVAKHFIEKFKWDRYK
jgi:hypothetical protein